MNRVLAVTGTSLEIAGSLTGIPYVGAAAILLNQIAGCCNEIQVKKIKSRQLASRCTTLILALEEHASRLAGSELQQCADELQPVLETILRRVRTWSRYNRVQCFIWNGDIEKGIEQCTSELESALGIFNVNAQIIGNTLHRESINLTRAQTADIQELREMIGQILTSRQDMDQVVEMQAKGTRAAEIVMRAGQQELRVMREAENHDPDQPTATSSRALQNTNDTTNTNPQTTPHTNNNPTTNSHTHTNTRYMEYQRNLLDLHRLTGVPPSVKVLNGEVTKVGELAVAGGTYSDVWMGRWLDGEEVALKALRNVRVADPRAKQRFEREIQVWSELEHDNILPFYGIVTDFGNHVHMVSPWQANGNALEYTKAHPETDRLALLIGAARGLEYLHQSGVVHGNVKCANILVSANGDARICDFGMSKIISQITEQPVSVTMTNTGSARWLAPELIDGRVHGPSREGDGYAFGMTVLELWTGREPYAEVRRGVAVICEKVMKGVLPMRPGGQLVRKGGGGEGGGGNGGGERGGNGGGGGEMGDAMWGILEDCWKARPEERPSVGSVRRRLEDLNLNVNPDVIQ